MSASTTSTHRWQILLGIALTIVVALGFAMVASGASSRGSAGASPQVAARPVAAGDCVAIGTLVSATTSMTATTSTKGAGASPKTVRAGLDAARGRATELARTTASAEARERAQNLADDLAAYRVSVAAAAPTARHADVLATVHDDVTALRRLCGL